MGLYGWGCLIDGEGRGRDVDADADAGSAGGVLDMVDLESEGFAVEWIYANDCCCWLMVFWNGRLR